MSIESWKKEFYSVEAAHTSPFTELEIIEHSLTKWLGLSKANTKKHGLEYEDQTLYLKGKDFEGNFFRMNSRSCSLCENYWDKWGDGGKQCDRCPVFKLTGYDCSDAYFGETPKQMIDLLTKVYINELEKEKK